MDIVSSVVQEASLGLPFITEVNVRVRDHTYFSPLSHKCPKHVLTQRISV